MVTQSSALGALAGSGREHCSHPSRERAQDQARPSSLGTKRCLPPRCPGDQPTEGDRPESWVVLSHALDSPVSCY